MEKEPFILTGASATGKTTLAEFAIANGYIHIPTHTTRTQRPGEIEGVHNVFLNKDQFKKNFENGLYLEDSLKFAYMPQIDTYYGTLSSSGDLLQNEGFCASPVSIEIARKIVDLSGVNWFHLVCEDNDRRERLRKRGITEEEVERRMTFGDSINVPDDATEVLNTSKYATDSLYKYIKRLRRKKV
jgi:guanylate kinase